MRSTLSWYSKQASPTMPKSFKTVSFATPVSRTVDRTEQSSTRAETTATRLSLVRMFMALLCVSGNALLGNLITDLVIDFLDMPPENRLLFR